MCILLVCMGPECNDVGEELGSQCQGAIDHYSFQTRTAKEIASQKQVISFICSRINRVHCCGRNWERQRYCVYSHLGASVKTN